jgi:hypothetical protein
MSYFDEPQPIDPIFIDCPDCKGGVHSLSDCCGANMNTDMGICYECKDHCEPQDCDTCKGVGQIEVTGEEMRDDMADLKHDENNNN